MPSQEPEPIKAKPAEVLVAQTGRFSGQIVTHTEQSGVNDVRKEIVPLADAIKKFIDQSSD